MSIAIVRDTIGTIMMIYIYMYCGLARFHPSRVIRRCMSCSSGNIRSKVSAIGRLRIIHIHVMTTMANSGSGSTSSGNIIAADAVVAFVSIALAAIPTASTIVISAPHTTMSTSSSVPISARASRAGSPLLLLLLLLDDNDAYG